MKNRIRYTYVSEKHFFDRFKYAIFEGAQGLALDQFYGNYPYVTRSNTGMRNVLELQRRNDYTGKGNFEIDEIVYVSRTYETRHGNDPAFIEETMPEKVKDETNIPNEWQRKLRYRTLSYQELGRRIALDIYANNLSDYAPEGKIKLALTHRDQMRINYGKLFHLVGRATNNIITTAFYRSSGETYKDVEYIPDEGRKYKKLM
jgi:hypothetical protein